MERPPDKLVGDVRAVEVGGVDMVDPERDRLAQHGERGVHITGRTPDMRAGELHGAVAHATQRCVAARQREAAAKMGRSVHRYTSLLLLRQVLSMSDATRAYS